jgi:hypothetical protein
MLVISIHELQPGFSTMPAYDVQRRVIIHLNTRIQHLKTWKVTFQQELQVEGPAQCGTCSNKNSAHLFQGPEK